MRPSNGALQHDNVLPHLFRIELRNLMLDGLDRGLELPNALPVTREQGDRERPNLLRNLRLEDFEGRLPSRRHQHATTCGEIMTDDIGDCMGLPRTGWPLDGYPRRSFQTLDDRDLFVVVRKG